MDYYSNQMSKLIEELSCLPGIGAKSAARLAFHLIHMPVDDVKRLASTMVEARENIKYCKECYTLTDQELCPICSNSNRDHQTIMVVENTRDLAAYEKTGKYNGVYHVLHGAISPMLGIGPEDIKLKELIEAHGGKNLAAVSANVDFLVAGEKIGPAKLQKATKLGVRLISEEELLAMIASGGTLPVTENASDGNTSAAPPSAQETTDKTDGGNTEQGSLF